MTHRVFLVHGFNVSDCGAKSIDRLRPALEAAGFEVHDFDYGWRGLIGVRLLNEKTADKLSALIQEGDVLIGHSNGCDLIHRAIVDSELDCAAVFINPALDTDTRFPPNLKWLDVYHNHRDTATWWARWLVFHPWGAMGRVGYKGDDPRVRNFDTMGPFLPHAPGHSGVFNKKVVGFYSRFIANRIHDRA